MGRTLIHIESGRKVKKPLRYVHSEGTGWSITSDIPVEGILECDVMTRKLPGCLGTYWYPSDSVYQGEVAFDSLCEQEVSSTSNSSRNIFHTTPSLTTSDIPEEEDKDFVCEEYGGEEDCGDEGGTVECIDEEGEYEEEEEECEEGIEAYGNEDWSDGE